MKTHISNFLACVAGSLVIAAPFILSALGVVKG
jgi:hypothetical protein